jgi:hypothetical protein
MSRLMEKMKSHARNEDLEVTWRELRNEFREKVDPLSPHELRRLRVDMEGWLTRTRHNEKQ